MRHVLGTSRDREPSAQLTDRALGAEVTRKARCADGTLDPDEWFPVSTEAEAARREAAGAIAICTACPVRGACLELSLRHWTIGQHGVWGGLVAADRAALRRRWVASPHEYGRALSILDRIWGRTPGNQSRRAKGPARHYGRHLAPRLVPHASSQDGPRDAQTPDGSATRSSPGPTGRPQYPARRLGPADGAGSGQADALGGRRAASPYQAG